MYTPINMVHAVYAYGEYQKLYPWYRCHEDTDIRCIAEGALMDQPGFTEGTGFSAEEMKIWNQEVLINMANPTL